MSNRKSDYITKLVPRLDLNKVITEDILTQQLYLQDKTKDFNQDWQFITDEYGVIIKNVGTGRILGCTENMENLKTYPEGTKSRLCRWSLRIADSPLFSDSYHFVVNMADETKVLEVVNASAQDSSIILSKNTNSHSQMFYLDRQSCILDSTQCVPEKLSTWCLEENQYISYEDLKYKIFSSEYFLKNGLILHPCWVLHWFLEPMQRKLVKTIV